MPDFGINEAPLRAILAKFTYKPGWRFYVEKGMLRVDAMVVDAYDHNKMTPLGYLHGIPSHVREDFPWERWLLDQIIEIERHEAMEFFEIDGVKVFDPHG